MAHKVKISEYKGKADLSDREAYIYLNFDNNYSVEHIVRQKGKIVFKREVSLKDGSIYHAEDEAENWINGETN